MDRLRDQLTESKAQVTRRQSEVEVALTDSRQFSAQADDIERWCVQLQQSHNALPEVSADDAVRLQAALEQCQVGTDSSIVL